MTILEAIPHIEAQINLKRTPYGRPINDEAIAYLQSIIEDENNYGQEAVQCLNCGLIYSALLSSESCPNCGGIDLTSDINQKKEKIEKE